VLRQSGETARTIAENERSEPPRARRRRSVAWVAALAVAFAIVGTLFALRPRQRAGSVDREYAALTNFADSVVSPALSPDGRMLPCVGGENRVAGPGQVYVKFLPDGDPVQWTNDPYWKMSPKFTPDGTRIAYSTAIGSSTASEGEASMDTWIVPVLGGAPS